MINWCFKVDAPYYFDTEVKDLPGGLTLNGTRIAPDGPAWVTGRDAVDRDGVETHRLQIRLLVNGYVYGIARRFPKRTGSSIEISTKRRAANMINELKKQGVFSKYK